MSESTDSIRQLSSASKHLARLLLVIEKKRFGLLFVEVQEERNRLLHAILIESGQMKRCL